MSRRPSDSAGKQMVFNNALLSASCPPASQPHKCTHIHTISLPLPHSLCLTHTHTHTHTQTPCEARFTTFLPNWAFEKKFVEDKSHVIVVTKKVCLLWKKKNNITTILRMLIDSGVGYLATRRQEPAAHPAHVGKQRWYRLQSQHGVIC